MLRTAAMQEAPYDLALLDMQMPGMDGLYLARTIKADPTLATLPVVMLTSITQRGHEELVQQAGIAAYLTKPVRQSHFFDCLTLVKSTSVPATDAPCGSPVRVLVPGWIGVANIKWVGHIEVSEAALFSHWNTDTYILLGSDYQAYPPAKGPLLSMQNLKSALELDMGAQIQAGRQRMTGRSWSPYGKITRVEYSLDQGLTWQLARLQEPRIAQAWAQWDFDWDARPGHYMIRVKASDEQGHTQPERVPWNEQGYLYNAIVDHPVTVA